MKTTSTDCSEQHAKLDLIKGIEEELKTSSGVKDMKKWALQAKNQLRAKLSELKKDK